MLLSAGDECNVADVRYDGDSLNLVDGECRLPSLTGRLTLKYTSGDQRDLPLFEETAPLIFKLQDGWTGVGRKVGGIGSGHFIVVAPDAWQRTGHVPVKSETCVSSGFTAHYFFRGRQQGANDPGNFKECQVELASEVFEIDGDQVFDDSEHGPLFIGAVPQLRPASNVAWARVGEEQAGGWKGTSFRPNERLLSEVLHGREGRFFLRVYDADVKLLDSMEFRYCADLREIWVNGAPYTRNKLLIPPVTGHPRIEVRFVGAGGTTLSPILTNSADHATVMDGVVVVMPHPDGDEISCALGSDAGHVEASIRLPRMWWRVDGIDDEARRWRDTPLALTRQEFREHADANSVIRMRVPEHLGSVKVGFDDGMDRSYRPASEEAVTKHGIVRSISIPLEEFVDYRQIDQRLYQDATLSANCGGDPLPLIHVSADPVPLKLSEAMEEVAADVTVAVRARSHHGDKLVPRVAGKGEWSPIPPRCTRGQHQWLPAESRPADWSIDTNEQCRWCYAHRQKRRGRAMYCPAELDGRQRLATRKGIQPTRTSRRRRNRGGGEAPFHPRRSASPERSRHEHRHTDEGD